MSALQKLTVNFLSERPKGSLTIFFPFLVGTGADNETGQPAQSNFEEEDDQDYRSNFNFDSLTNENEKTVITESGSSDQLKESERSIRFEVAYRKRVIS